MTNLQTYAWAGLIAAAALAGGCSKTANSGGAAMQEAGSATEKTVEGHSHGGWWCDEHGVPEEICGQCNSKLAGEFQKKGDWCREHDRPDSQCFKCHPDLETAFAARYEAKTGQKPPKPAG